MPRSKAVAPAADDERVDKLNQGNMEDRGERTKGASAKKKGDKGSAKKKKQRESAKDARNIEAIDDVDFEQDGGSTEAATRNTRDVLREEVMTQVPRRSRVVRTNNLMHCKSTYFGAPCVR